MPPWPISIKWTAIGPHVGYLLGQDRALWGEQSPGAKLGSAPRGFAQSHISLVRGRPTGRIVVSAEQDTEITLTLIGELNRQTVKLKAGKAWSTVPFSFTAASDTTEALEITATGGGSFRVGAVSMMPADNIKGFRADTIALMKEMDCKTLRMPGAISFPYDWKPIGDPDKRADF